MTPFKYSSFWLVLPVLIVASCTQAVKNNNMDQEKNEIPVEYRYLALGDSYTIGESVDSSGRWPVQLTDSLYRQNIIPVDLTVVAKTGWTTDELMAGIDQSSVSGIYHLVSLLIGVNNQYRGRDTAEYRMQYRQLLDMAIDFAGGDPTHVIVVSIPDYGVTPFAAGKDPVKIAREIDEFNAIKQEETTNSGARFIDITGISRLAASDQQLIAADGLHPSDKMYSEWVKLILPEAVNLLKINN